MNVAHYGNHYDVFKWSWLIDFAHRRGCGELKYLPFQTDVKPAEPWRWAEPKITSGHCTLAQTVAEFFEAEHRLFARGNGVRDLKRLGSLLSQAGITASIDARTYQRSASMAYLTGLRPARGTKRTLMVIDPDNGLCDPAGAYAGFCRHGNDMHVSIDDIHAAVGRVLPHAIAVTQYNTRKPGCFDDVRRLFRTVGPKDGHTEFRVFRGRVVLAMKELREW